MFYVLGSGSTVPVVSISGVTIEGGRAPDASSLGPNNGGGIEVSDATLTVNQSVIENNRTGNGGSYAGQGGGINVNGGTLTVTNSTITANTTGTGSTFGGSGGGISSDGSSRSRSTTARSATTRPATAATTCRPAAEAESTVKGRRP